METLQTADFKPGRSMTRLACTGLAGTSVEWYDFFLYGTAAALVFPTVFFPKNLPPAVALLASFSTFAVGFVARPIGALVFGHFGDRAGRKTALAAALILMGSATTLIGLLPTYRTVGILAPVLLPAGGAVCGVVHDTCALLGSFAWISARLGLRRSACPDYRDHPTRQIPKQCWNIGLCCSHLRGLASVGGTAEGNVPGRASQGSGCVRLGGASVGWPMCFSSTCCRNCPPSFV